MTGEPMPDAINGAYYNVAITTSDQIVLPQSGHRKVIILSVLNSSGFVNIAFGRAAGTTSDYGLHIYGGQHIFRREDIGGLIDTDLHAIGSAATGLGIFVGYE